MPMGFCGSLCCREAMECPSGYPVLLLIPAVNQGFLVCCIALCDPPSLLKFAFIRVGRTKHDIRGALETPRSQALLIRFIGRRSAIDFVRIRRQRMTFLDTPNCFECPLVVKDFRLAVPHGLILLSFVFPALLS